MNSGPTSERIYGALKTRLFANTYPPGERLDPTLLAGELASSATPVRDALHLLAGERLVDIRTGDGFHVPHLTGPGLDDLYAWNADVLLLSIRRRRPLDETAIPLADEADGIPGRTSALFSSIAQRSINAEHALAVATIGNRLRPVRVVEEAVLGGLGEELDRIGAAIDDDRALRKAISLYHNRRRRAAFDIIRALYRTS